MGFKTQVGFAPCFEGYNTSAVKKGQEESSYLSEKQLQEAIKAQKCIQQKQFLVPLSLWQSTCFHLHREIDREREREQGGYSLWGVIPSLSPCLPFLITILHCLLSTDVAWKLWNKEKQFGLTRYCWESTTRSHKAWWMVARFQAEPRPSPKKRTGVSGNGRDGSLRWSSECERSVYPMSLKWARS